MLVSPDLRRFCAALAAATMAILAALVGGVSSGVLSGQRLDTAPATSNTLDLNNLSTVGLTVELADGPVADLPPPLVQSAILVSFVLATGVVIVAAGTVRNRGSATVEGRAPPVW